MKVTKLLFGAALSSALLFASCSNIADASESAIVEDSTRAATTLSSLSGDNGAISYNSTYSMYTITGSKVTNGWNYAKVDLSKFSNQTVTIDFGASMQVDNSGSAVNLAWVINTDGYPTIASKSFGKGSSSWGWVSGSKTLKLGTNNVLYLSSYNTTPKNLKINVSSLSVKVTTSSTSSGSSSSSINTAANPVMNWRSAPSLKNAYSKYFDYFGFAVEYGTSGNGQLAQSEVQKGLAYQGNTITMGNEFKPDFVFNWVTPNNNGSFTSSSGKTISVPTNTPNFDRIDRILSICKNNGLKMRGHVLVWHSQTPKWFFCKDYNTSKGTVDVATMNARLEWYIKTVIEHVNNWERANNGGKHVIWAWDVVNEAAADDAYGSNFLRGSTGGSSGSSMWYQVYRNADFIANAFRYANKYAPKDVKLCYNDYNCYLTAKTNAICTIIDKIKACENWDFLPSRIDAIGMQSHVSVNYPGVSGYQSAMKRFIAKGLDVHVSEFDITNDKIAYNASNNRQLYKDYFKMFRNNRKTSSSKGVTCVTIWGIDDGTSWLQHNYSTRQYPLLFKANGNSFVTKPEFYGVLEAAQ